MFDFRNISLSLVFLVTGLANLLLLLFLAGYFASVSFLGVLIILDAFLLFFIPLLSLTARNSLFHEKRWVMIGAMSLIPILFWYLLVIWEQRYSLSHLLNIAFLFPFVSTLAATLVSLVVLLRK